MQSDKERLKCLMNFSPVSVLSMSLFRRFVKLTKNIVPRKVRKTPSGTETLESPSNFETVPNAKINDAKTRKESLKIVVRMETILGFRLIL